MSYQLGVDLMSYQLGADLGTTFSTAAIARAGHVELFHLGQRALVVPSVLYLPEGESVLVGEAANRRGLGDPSRVAREFKRRLGDPVPILLDGSPYSAEALMARQLRWIFDEVVAQEGSAPNHVVLTHPANWGPYKLHVFGQVVNLAGLSDVTFLPEPVAAIGSCRFRSSLDGSSGGSHGRRAADGY